MFVLFWLLACIFFLLNLVLCRLNLVLCRLLVALLSGFWCACFFVLRMYSLLPFHVASRPAALLSVVRCRAEHIVADDDVVAL